MAGSFKQINNSDQNIQLFQNNVADALMPLQQVPMVGGNLLKNISLTSGQDNLIQHGLDHAPTVFFIGNMNVDTRVWSPATVSLSGSNVSRTTINLRCSTTCVIALWIN